MADVTRKAWIAGLVFALCAWGGVALLCLIGLVTRHHLNATRWTVLFVSAYICYITFAYLRTKLSPNLKPFKKRTHL
jgi:hypothetical protein